MKSSTGKYYIGLDHIRAVAIFMVFSWHFMHQEISFTYTPSFFPLSLINEGHTGVSLFMALSGYLFAKLLDGKKIKYASFLWNRFLRLAPLLFFVVTVIGIHQYSIGVPFDLYCLEILKGLILPTLPNGGWSIAIEFHFYLLLPFLLYIARKSNYSLGFTICFAILLRLFLYEEVGQIQRFAYYTIIGRIDQFLFGMIAYQMRGYIMGRHILVIGSFIAFSIFFWNFDQSGGFHNNPSYPSNRLVWVVMPTFEGLTYALLIAWYDNSFMHSTSRFSRFIALIGTYSYSIYLLHFFFYKVLILIMVRYIMPVSNFYIALCYSVLGFLFMVPIGYLSFRLIESPFLKLRTNYIIKNDTERVLEVRSCNRLGSSDG
ncbi:acyltransferase family protein [Gimesia aquarii]|uniref:Acyltransferase family protein n=1 Tax=Gimesia aquarii TaxID=2527964 RepID=A0A517X3H5_9PLAN|nr:acyltransferase [Gimesia aquarii]QDU12061.1 Acyltransferase family protein [Gimesia aquarii]